MDRYDRLAAVRRAGIAQKAIAERQGVSESMVSQVIAGKKRHAGIEREIACALDKSVAELWPEARERAA